MSTLSEPVRPATVRRYDLNWEYNGDCQSFVPGALVTCQRTGETWDGKVTGVRLEIDAAEAMFDEHIDIWPFEVTLTRNNKSVTFAGRRWHYSHPCDGVAIVESATWYATIDGVPYVLEVNCE